jgi:FkbM family methyltransferase
MPEQQISDIRDISKMSRMEIEKASEKLAKTIYLGDNLVLCRMLTKYKMFLDSRDLSVVPNILMDGYWESWVTKFFAKVVKPGDVCIDAGANFGYFSLLLAELSGRHGKTIAIEANSYLCELLSKTAAINEYNFTVVHKALSDQKSEMILSVPTNFWGGGHVIKTRRENGESQETIAADSLDNIVEQENLERVDFVKIDCEGQEPSVLAGMEKTIRRNPGIRIVMEYSPCIYEDAAGFTDKLFSLFNIGEVTGNSDVKPYSRKDMDYLLSLRGHIDLFMEVKK